MPEFISEFLNKYAIMLTYIALISLISVAATAIDKASAIDGGRRVPERTLLLLSALGGSVAMLCTMLIIRHKTRHKKFMIGIPLIIVLQALAVIAFISLTSQLQAYF